MVPSLVAPALIDGVLDNIVKVVPTDTADKENLNVVLNRDQLGVVDAGLRCEFLGRVVELHLYRGKAQLRLAFDVPRLSAAVIDDAVLGRFDSLLSAASTLVGQDGTVKRRSHMSANLRVTKGATEFTRFARVYKFHLHACTVTFVISNHNKAPDTHVKSLA